MSVHLVVKNCLPASASPYRLLDDRGSQVAWANQFLDAQKVRQLSLRSLRAYAYDLLHLARWFKNTRHSLGRLNQSLLLEYVRHQLEQQPSPTPQTINHRLCALRCLYRFHYAQEIPGKPLFQRRYTTRSSLGYGRRQTKITTNLRLRQPRRVIVPLSADQVARFWKGFRTFRDLAIVALMLQNGLRSCEVLQLQLEDLRLSEARLHVLGKGRKQRFLPLTADTLQVLQNYLHLERPLTNSPALFVSLKGPAPRSLHDRRGIALPISPSSLPKPQLEPQPQDLFDFSHGRSPGRHPVLLMDGVSMPVNCPAPLHLLLLACGKHSAPSRTPFR